MGSSNWGFGKVVLVAGGAILALKVGSQYLLPLLRAKNAGEKFVPVFQNFSFGKSNFSAAILTFDILCKNPANTPLSFTYPFTMIKVDGKDFGSSEPKKDLITIPAFSQKILPYSVEMKLGSFLVTAFNTLINKVTGNGVNTVVTGELLTYIEGTAAYTTTFTKTI